MLSNKIFSHPTFEYRPNRKNKQQDLNNDTFFWHIPFLKVSHKKTDCSSLIAFEIQNLNYHAIRDFSAIRF
jgi:hypothetical protein